jgi:bla regulator protein BlaR1
MHELLEDCKEAMGVSTPLQMIVCDEVPSPALFGLIRPRLLMPEGLLRGFSREDLRFVLLHELAHVKRGDILVNWLLTGLQILHWFNPIVWLAFARLRADRELACDELALKVAGDAGRKPYGETIIRLLEEFSRPARLPGLAGVLEEKSHMHRRIAMIASSPSSSAFGFATVAALFALALVGLTDARHPVFPPDTRGDASGDGSDLFVKTLAGDSSQGEQGGHRTQATFS